ncbi:bifunctional diguanylate cyclase/phosphodiesterase [Desulfuromonas acetoxidans]|uniref:Diguanylate cyclase/phosphodiesterase with PAS/PAC sensor(S) n=1 Tax=Desulfuromonas acetoxidans (strain DSM 684 / 11070) TaxID=281689 RepID=Q1JVN0_DESA6|nr:EAL domain-containing protein [Desulfuromonas acetoxidans]EAT14291.1 diguanylate cyclase/phosphodiesterase with PAS/PAC sensor(s) [Desulfuromonas acetoxidans DSM 684]MBF0647131.1 EAL domain-containing protein [Desulfuromonas acetoxidans]NVD25058.1 EAL domain-containing protein [Desulfuromonas acetoxidans]NVE17103.1 EAL domain-containing protein [Desulfuromonas acetoxidans]
MKWSEICRRKNLCVDFLVLPILGALLLSALSVVQKLYIGAPVWRVQVYYFPAVYGSIAGGLVGIWSRRLRQALVKQVKLQEHYLDLFENASDLIQSVRLDGSILYVNRAWKETLGYLDHDIPSLNIFDVISSADRPICRNRVISLLDGAELGPIEVTFQCKDGRAVLLEGNISLRQDEGQPHSVRGIFRNISERKQAEQKIHQLAYYDTLTGLPNRVLLQDRLIHAIADARRFSHYLAVMFIDLDQFKKVNDTLGHSVGDLLLKDAARRLRSCLRDNDTAARLGGDEFVVILSGFKQISNLPHIARKVLDVLSQPYFLAERELVVSASLGISVYPQDGDNAELLMRNADMAMYAAKYDHGNGYCFFSEEMNKNATRQLELEEQLRHALIDQQFEVYFQPQFDWSRQKLTGVEALVRWNRAQGEVVPPEMFIPVVESTGQIVALGEWVLRQACLQIQQLQCQLNVPLQLSVNLSGRQFDDLSLIYKVKKILQETNFPPEQLELEITETILMENADSARKTLGQLSQQGIRLAIDDFGTGYSSLNYLNTFPVDRLKIDKSFLVNVMHDDNHAAIVATIISMADTLGLSVIAEGVETMEQVSFLSDLGCQAMQGFIFSEPLPREELEEFVQKGWPFQQ